MQVVTSSQRRYRVAAKNAQILLYAKKLIVASYAGTCKRAPLTSTTIEIYESLSIAFTPCILQTILYQREMIYSMETVSTSQKHIQVCQVKTTQVTTTFLGW